MGKILHTLKNTNTERQLFQRRVIALIAGVFILAILLIARLAYLQISQHHFYTTLARQNLLNLLPDDPNRGLIYDRNGVLLAENVPVFNLVVTPNRVSDLKTTLAELQKLLPITLDDLQQFHKQFSLQRRFAPVVLHTRLTEEEVARFSVNQYRFPGVAIQTEMVRHYPLGAAMAQVVGYVGRINAKELAAVDPSNYSATNFIGKTGVEKYYETQLHGTVGYLQAETDATGKVVRTLNATPPVPGNNLYLTIDSRLQLAVEQILGDARGAVVIIDPQTGDLLAMVSNPSYDPNLFVTGIDKQDYEALENAPGQPLYNRALRGRYAPGSTIKPFIALGGLASGVVTPDYTIFDPGWFKLKTSSHIYHDWRHMGHGTVNVIKAIAESCDTYFYNLAFKMGIERIGGILQQFGFGQPTGVDLYNEASGLVPSPDWKQRVLHTAWYPGDTLITGIGQGFLLATPLQLASAVATLAMRGEHLQPHVLLRSQASDGSITRVPVKLLPPVTLDKAVWNTVIAGMQNVVSAPDGTAYHFFQGVTYSLAAKTGTAQVFSLKGNEKDNSAILPENLRDNSLFVAFAPIQNPRIAIVVVLPHSTVSAAVIARQIMDVYFKNASAS
jgi:penicillin-binding protein 2